MALGRMLSRAYRDARRAEAAGKFREAAAFYAEAGARKEAADALLFHASRQTAPRERIEAFTAALAFLEDDDARRDDLETQIALARLEAASRTGTGDASARDELRDAARTLTRLGKDAEAAAAWELLGDLDELAAALTRAGEVEKLEQLLERRVSRESVEQRVEGLVRDHEAALQSGARDEARAALQRALALAPGDTPVRDLLRRLEARATAASRVELRVDGRRVIATTRVPAVLGRDADLPVRGATVSRRHAELARVGDAWVIRDLGARNGTLVAGVPLAAALAVTAEGLTIGLGEDVEVLLVRDGDGVRGEVRRGPDRDTSFVVGEGALRVPGAAATLTFSNGLPTLLADEGVTATLDGVPCRTGIGLLRADVIAVGAVRIEVIA